MSPQFPGVRMVEAPPYRHDRAALQYRRVDYLTAAGAERLAQMIREAWAGLGRPIDVWVTPVYPDREPGRQVWAVRSRSCNGVPS